MLRIDEGQDMTAIPPLQDLDDRSFNPFFADEMVIGDFDDPYPLIHNLMGKGSVHEVNYPTLFACGTDPTLTPFPHYTVTGYDAVVEVWIGEKRACFALEYERSLKSSKQYERVRRALECERQIGCVLYLTSGVEILVHLVHEFESVTMNLAFANARDFAHLLLDTRVITGRNTSGMTFREILQ